VFLFFCDKNNGRHDKNNGWRAVIRLLALVYYAMAASTGVEVANFNLAYLCEGNYVSQPQQKQQHQQ